MPVVQKTGDMLVPPEKEVSGHVSWKYNDVPVVGPTSTLGWTCWYTKCVSERGNMIEQGHCDDTLYTC